MKATSCLYTNAGGRRENEDTITSVEYDNFCLYAVCDGLGGHQNGKAASLAAANALSNALASKRPPSAEALENAFRLANEAVLEGQKEQGFESMKSTMVALVLTGEKALWAHVGDSRLYCFRKGELEFVTPDHSVSYRKFRAGEMTFDAIAQDEDRSGLLRVLGSRSSPGPELGSEPMTVLPGDAFLLCSDGFWEYLQCGELSADLLKSDTPEEWLHYLLARHAERCRKDNDNFSAIAVMVE